MQDLVYRPISHIPDQLVFSPRELAFRVHLIWTAIKCAKTWGEFIDMLPVGEWQELCRSPDGDLPRRKDKFNEEWLPGFSDGDYPPWLQTKINQFIPGIALEEFGLRESSVLNGPFWKIPTEMEEPLVDRLQQLGYSIERKDDWHFY